MGGFALPDFGLGFCATGADCVVDFAAGALEAEVYGACDPLEEIGLPPEPVLIARVFAGDGCVAALEGTGLGAFKIDGGATASAFRACAKKKSAAPETKTTALLNRMICFEFIALQPAASLGTPMTPPH
jgi:hypothetical protein